MLFDAPGHQLNVHRCQLFEASNQSVTLQARQELCRIVTWTGVQNLEAAFIQANGAIAEEVQRCLGQLASLTASTELPAADDDGQLEPEISSYALDDLQNSLHSTNGDTQENGDASAQHLFQKPLAPVAVPLSQGLVNHRPRCASLVPALSATVYLGDRNQIVCL